MRILILMSETAWWTIASMVLAILLAFLAPGAFTRIKRRWSQSQKVGKGGIGIQSGRDTRIDDTKIEGRK